MKILIVEDDLMIAFQLKDDLEEAGHLVNAIVRNPFDALTALRNDPPDLAILDITLENGRDEGIELAKLLPNFGNLPFIFLTGRTDTYLMHLAEKAKPYAYLFKPYRKEELLMQISLAYNSFKEKSVELPANYDCFYLKNNGVHERIDYEALLYVKSNRHSVSIFTTHDRKPYVVGTNLSEIISYFTHPDLLLLSPSLIVNKKHIRQLYRKSLSLNHVAEDLEITDRGRKVLLNTLNILKTKSSKK
jgi:DNA-binding LytR/AlgR family response regulator